LNIKTHGQGGTTASQVGYRCADCQADVDTGQMLAKAEKERKKREIAQLQEEIGDEPVTVKRELAKTSK
jgi:hypothetical protein